MRQIKNILIPIFLILTLFIQTGCLQNKALPSSRQMVAWINQKYTDDLFTYKCPCSSGTSSNWKQITLTSKNYPDDEIIVSYNSDEHIFTDNYLSVRYKERTSQYYENLLSNCLPTLRWYSYQISSLAFIQSLSSTASFEDYLADKNSMINFDAVIQIDEAFSKELIEQKISDEIAGKNICFHCTLYFNENPSNLSFLSEDDLSVYLYEDGYKYCVNVLYNAQENELQFQWD